MMNKAVSVVNYYVICNKLKDMIRTGWKVWNVKRDRVESVAEHIFGVQSLAIAIWSQYEYDVDIHNVILMLAVHELEETIIGDLTLWDIKEEDKKQQGHQAIQEILKEFIQKDKIEQLILEFDDRKSKDAIFAYQCDKLEGAIQSKLYDEKDCVDLNAQKGNYVFPDEKVQDICKTKDTWSAMWIEYGRKNYEYDENFIEILDYIENNDIS